MGTLISKKHQIRRVVATAYEAPWAITRDKLDAIVDLLDRRSQGHLDEKEIEARLAGFQAQSRYDDDEEDDRPYRLVGGVAVIPLYGVLMPRGNLVTRMSGGMSTQEFTAAVQAALDDDDVRRIVLDVDSPGGSVLGIEEAAELVRAVNDRKPVVTAATNQMASAAYWIGAAAGEVVASPSTQVGCIGVFSVHSDYSAADTTAGIKRTVIFAGPNKTLGNPHETLSQDGRDGLRQESNDYYEAMLAGLARYRGLSIEALQQRLGQRNTLRAPDAREAGLIDRVATLSEVVAGLADKPPTQASTTGFSREENAMDPRIMQALIQRGLIDGNTTKDGAQGVLTGWYAAQGKQVPGSPDDVLADLAKEKTPAKQPAGKAQAEKQEGTELVVATTLETMAEPLRPFSSEAEKREATLAERHRIREIRDRGALLGVDAATIVAAENNGTSIEQFLLTSTEQKAAEESPVGRLQPKQAQADTFASAAVEMLTSRGGVNDKPLGTAAGQMEHFSLVELARESFRLGGQRITGDKEDIARAAMGDDEMARNLGADAPIHGPGSFPNILSALANKVLEAAPPYQGTTFQNWAAKKPSVPDFKPTTLLRYGEFGEMPEHIDGQDFEQTTISEEYGWIQVDSYGDEFALTPVMIANDDLGVFLEAISDKPAAHDATLNRLCCNILTGNPTLVDGVALFHAATHKNYVATGSGAVPSETTLTAARLLFRALTGPSNKRKLNLTADYLLSPFALETGVQKLLTATLQIYPTSTANTEIFRYTVDYDVEPMLDDASSTAWYLFARKARPIVYCHQRGYENMKKRNYYNPKNNCRIFQFEGRFAAAVSSYRGVFCNFGV